MTMDTGRQWHFISWGDDERERGGDLGGGDDGGGGGRITAGAAVEGKSDTSS